VYRGTRSTGIGNHDLLVSNYKLDAAVGFRWLLMIRAGAPRAGARRGSACNTRPTQMTWTTEVLDERAGQGRQTEGTMRRRGKGVKDAEAASAPAGRRKGQVEEERRTRRTPRVGSASYHDQSQGGAVTSAAARTALQDHGGGGVRKNKRMIGGMVSPYFRIGTAETVRGRGPARGTRPTLQTF
jgi:hypothetical protein